MTSPGKDTKTQPATYQQLCSGERLSTSLLRFASVHLFSPAKSFLNSYQNKLPFKWLLFQDVLVNTGPDFHTALPSLHLSWLSPKGEAFETDQLIATAVSYKTAPWRDRLPQEGLVTWFPHPNGKPSEPLVSKCSGKSKTGMKSTTLGKFH